MAAEAKTREQIIAAFRAALVAGTNAENTRIQESATRRGLTESLGNISSFRREP